MKVFISSINKKFYVSLNNCHLCEDEELLIFPEIIRREIPDTYSRYMVGMQSNSPTTKIEIRDLAIDREFYIEYIVGCIHSLLGIEVDDQGFFEIEKGFILNVEAVADSLINHASKYRDGYRF